MKKFPEILTRRREIASHYFSELKECPGISLPVNNPGHTWQTFMIVLENGFARSKVMDKLAAVGLSTGPGSVSGHCLKVYQEGFDYKNADLPISKRLDSQGLALPLYESLSEQQRIEVVQRLQEAVYESVE